jgi:RNA polymerase sigma-70 factor (ECF subfamily)
VSPDSDEFTRFVREVEPRLRRALVTTYGPERGREATAEALAWAFENRQRLAGVRSPVGFLYRVGQSRSRSRLEGRSHEPSWFEEPWVEPSLARALASLPEEQRFAVFMVHVAGWTGRELGDVLGVRAGTIRKRVERGMAELRRQLTGATNEAL